MYAKSLVEMMMYGLCSEKLWIQKISQYVTGRPPWYTEVFLRN
jgi:hypothetical protein